MENLKSILAFQSENFENCLMTKKQLNQVSGGIGGGQSYDCESRNTTDSRNCGDTEARTRRDGGDWSSWVQTSQELDNGSWQECYVMPC